MQYRFALRSLSLLVAFFCGASPLFAQVTWDGGGDGTSWSDPLNWSTDAVPTGSDDVALTTAVTINLDIPATVHDLTLSSTTLEGNQDLTIDGRFMWDGGTLRGSGTVAALGGIDFDSASFKNLTGRTLNITGDAEWRNGNILLGDGAVFNMANGSTLSVDLANNRAFLRTGSISTEPVLNIDGTLLILASSALPSLDVTVNISNTVFVEDGAQLDMGFGSSLTGGGIYLAGEAQVEFDGGTHDLAGQLGGTPGVFKPLDGDGLGNALVGNNATVNFNPGVDPQANLQNNGGDLFLNDTLTLPNYAGNGGTFGANVDASVTGAMNLQGSNNTISVGSGATLTTDEIIADGVNTRFSGTGTLEGVYTIQQPTTADGTQMIWEDGSLLNAPIGFTNDATATIPPNTTTEVFTDLVNDDGKVIVDGQLRAILKTRFNILVAIKDGGVMYIEGDETVLTNTEVNGTVQVDPGASVELRGGGTHLFNDGATFLGDVLFTKGDDPLIPVANTNGDVTFENLTVDSGNLFVDGTLTVTDNFTFQRGFNSPRLIGDGDDDMIVQGSSLFSSTSQVGSLEDINLTLAGETNHQSGTLQFVGSSTITIPESGTYTASLDEGPGGWLGEDALGNVVNAEGQIVFAGSPNLFLAQQVGLHVKAGGTASLENGNPTLDDFTQDSGGTLTYTVNDPPSTFTATTANLGGTLNATVPDGGEVQPGDEYIVIITTNGISGTWEDVNLIGGGENTIAAAYEDGAATITVITPAGSISGIVFNDITANNIFDPGEPGLPNASVFLLSEAGEVLQTTTTDTNGAYLFSDLQPGEYALSAAAPDGFTISFPIGNIFPVSLPQGEAVSGVNFAALPYRLTGRKFNDLNGNGQFDAGEPGLEGWLIQLEQNGELVSVDFTDASGDYGFDVMTGEYVVREVQQAGWIQTFPEAVSHTVEVTPENSSIGELDFGNTQAFSRLSGVKFEDLNGNGQRDEGEPGIEGWMITITDLNEDAVVVATGADGAFELDVSPGTYTIEEEQIPNWAQTFPLTNNGIYALNLSGGEIVENLDFGNAKLVEIGGTKFHDDNRNGLRDAGELVLSGWTFVLENNGEVIASATSGDNGIYFFEDQLPGTYTIREVPQIGWVQTFPIDNNGAYTVTLISDDEVALDFGNDRLEGQRITGTKFNDINGNKQRDTGEPGMEGWTIELLQEEQVIATAVTDGNGTYAFSELSTGTYTVREVQQQGWSQTFPEIDHVINLGAGDVRDGVDFGNVRTGTISGIKFNDLNANGLRDVGEPGMLWSFFLRKEGKLAGFFFSDTTGAFSIALPPGTYQVAEDPMSQFGWMPTFPNTEGIYRSVTVESGQFIDGLLFGNSKGAGHLRGLKYNDLNANGQRDEGEPPLGGWQIEVFDINGNLVRTAVTAGPDDPLYAEGAYAIPLPPGPFTVREVQQDAWVQTDPPSGAHLVEITSGETINDINFGNTQDLVPVSGVKFEDLNGNGQRDEGEPGIAGWVITATDIAERSVSDTTDANGAYRLGLPRRLHVIEEEQRDGWRQTSPTSNNGVYEVIPVSGEPISNLDFGNARPGLVGGFKFNDQNGNGIFDTGEPTMPGWTIQLEQNGQTIATTTTNDDGAYAFTDLLPGTYFVREVQQPGWVQTFPSDNDGVHQIAVTSGIASEGVHFGNTNTLGLIAGTKFNDLNGNGIRDDGEPGLAGWTITASGNGLFLTTTTAPDGSYALEVPPGTFNVFETQQDGWVATVPNTDPSGFLPIYRNITVEPSGFVDGLDFGNSQAVGRIEGFVFNDRNANQQREQDEPGLGGWQIEVVDSQLNVVATRLSSPDEPVVGSYGVVLPPGTYTVREVLQPNWVLTFPNNDRGDYQIELVAGQVLDGLDFGNAQTVGQISGFVYNDVNANGMLDDNDGALEGWTVELLTLEGTLVATTLTNADGVYTFASVPADQSYVIRTPKRLGWLQTVPTDNEGCHLVSVVAGTQYFCDFGHTQALGMVQGRVFNDLNGDGVQNDAEPYLTDQIIEVLNEERQVIAQTTTNSVGSYQVTLPVGIYFLQTMLPSNFAQTTPLGNGKRHPVSIGGGDVYEDLDFGLRKQIIINVDNLADAGTGSLRDAIDRINEGNADVIEFNVPPGSKLDVLSPLPPLQRPFIVRLSDEGNKQDGLFVLDGSNCAAPCDGLTVTGGGSSVQHLHLQHFPGYGLVVDASGNNTITSNILDSNIAGGLLLAGGFGNKIGSVTSDASNIIINNGGPGVEVRGGTGHRIVGNEITDNAGPGIDLGGDGPTPNDNQDLDEGPNGLQNTPVLTAVTNARIEGTLHSKSQTAFEVAFFANDACRTNGLEEGMQFLGTTIAETDALGNAAFLFDAPENAEAVTALVTAPDGSTSEFATCLGATPTATDINESPGGYQLEQNYPNPFNPQTTIRFALPERQFVRLEVIDLLGRVVAVVALQDYTAGEHSVTWKGQDRSGRLVPSGIYLYRMQAGAFTQTRRMTLIK